MRLSSSLIALTLALAGCPGGGARQDGPPDVRYGVDPCDRCQMIVSEERFAAAYLTPSGAARRFDDLGCLTAHPQERAELVAEVWVHDQETRAWLRGRDAWLVRAPDLITPMGTGLVAVSDEARARALAARAGGELLTFDAFMALGPRAWPARGEAP
ncbi:MAG: nitrous oxide reductase accessory protein NosL [Planctomycetota bacterium]|nr:nitrous oxide reductase accessory protein NosL [Planctomycetota bacterium]